MSSHDEVAADRYTAALYGAALEAKALDKVLEDLEGLVRLKEASGLDRFLGDPKHDAAAKTRVLEAIGAKLKSDLSVRFMKLLLKKRRLEILDEVVGRLRTKAESARGIVRAEVTLAREPGGAFRSKIETLLGNITQKKVLMKLSIQPGIIGGIVVRMGHYLLDASVSNRINMLRNVLSETNIN